MANAGTNAWRVENFPSCKGVDAVTITLEPYTARVTVARAVVPAVRCLVAICDKYGYKIRSVDTGGYHCRKITGGDTLSSHAFAIALDINWNSNPYTTRLVTDMPKAMTDEIQALRTKKTKTRVWRWGGDWDNRPDTAHGHYDAMHFEIVATFEQLAEGIAKWEHIAPGEVTEVTDTDLDLGDRVLRKGMKGDDVREAQEILGVKPTGYFGDLTYGAVIALQKRLGLVADGIIGPKTANALRKA